MSKSVKQRTKSNSIYSSSDDKHWIQRNPNAVISILFLTVGGILLGSCSTPHNIRETNLYWFIIPLRKISGGVLIFFGIGAVKRLIRK